MNQEIRWAIEFNQPVPEHRIVTLPLRVAYLSPFQILEKIFINCWFKNEMPISSFLNQQPNREIVNQEPPSTDKNARANVRDSFQELNNPIQSAHNNMLIWATWRCEIIALGKEKRIGIHWTLLLTLMNFDFNRATSMIKGIRTEWRQRSRHLGGWREGLTHTSGRPRRNSHLLAPSDVLKTGGAGSGAPECP